jgi:hypothetical protein
VLANTNPPDQLWLAGVYDGDDHDEAVTLLEQTTLSSHDRPRTVELLRALIRLAPARAAAPRGDLLPLSPHFRSPPTG